MSSHPHLRKAHPEAFRDIEPFLREKPPESIKHVQLLHVSPLSKSFLISFQNESPFVLKSYGFGDYELAMEEMRNLQWIRELLVESGLDRALVPEIVWASPENGLFATRYIHGENLDVIFRKQSRLWTISSTPYKASWITDLIKWHRALYDNIRLHDASLPIANNHAADCSHWVHCLTHSNRLPLGWRVSIGAKLERLEKAMAVAHEKSKLHHGDFAPWNIRVDNSGQLWVLDWRRLEKGHWLEAAYRFIYTLRISALSPLAKRGFYADLREEASGFLDHFEDAGFTVQKELFQLRAALRNLFYLCKRPSLNLKQRWVQHFWMKELMVVIETCTP